MEPITRIRFPLPEKISANKIYAGSANWAERNAAAKLFHKYMIQFRKIKIPKFPVEMTYRFYFVSNPLDVSNCFYMVKLLEDGLTTNNILRGDSPEYVSKLIVTSEKGPSDEVEISWQ